MEAKLLVLKPAKIFGDPDELANFRFANGRGFPTSYQRFATQYGWGRSLDEVWLKLTRASDATAALRAAPRQAVFEGFDSIS